MQIVRIQKRFRLIDYLQYCCKGGYRVAAFFSEQAIS